MTILGLLAGIGLTIAVYPYILQRLARKTLAQFSAENPNIGDPLSNYISLIMFQTTQAYRHLRSGLADQSQMELTNILAGYCSFLTMNEHRSESEQRTLDAIHRACDESETLRQAVDERGQESSEKRVNPLSMIFRPDSRCS